jgi:hypothetical protein
MQQSSHDHRRRPMGRVDRTESRRTRTIGPDGVTSAIGVHAQDMQKEGDGDGGPITSSCASALLNHGGLDHWDSPCFYRGFCSQAHEARHTFSRIFPYIKILRSHIPSRGVHYYQGVAQMALPATS